VKGKLKNEDLTCGKVKTEFVIFRSYEICTQTATLGDSETLQPCLRAGKFEMTEAV
jgi:hypothetical protein